MNNKVFICPFILPWNWSADYQRQTCLELSKRGFLVVAFMQKDAVNWWQKNVSKAPIEEYPKIKNIIFFQVINYLPFNRFIFIKQINQLINLLLIKIKFIKKRMILWIFDPDFYFFTILRRLKIISIYDCVDYHWQANEFINQSIRIRETQLIKKVNHFFVNSKILAKIHQIKREADLIVPQGFKLDFFQKYSTRKTTKQAIKSKIVGFIGGINSRIDWPLIIELAKNNPNLTFSFTGPIQDEAGKLAINKLQKLANFNYQQSVVKEKLVQAIETFAIGIIPYDISQQFNLYCYPMKLFEYFYCGKPVIATPITELTNFPKFVKIGKTPTDWQEHLDCLLSKPWPKTYQLEQRKLAIANSWQNKVGQILDYLKKDKLALKTK